MNPISQDPNDKVKSSPAWLANLNAAVDSLLHKIARYLSTKSEKLSPTQKKWSLLTAGILTGVLCLSLIFQPIIQWDDKSILLPYKTSPVTIIPQPNSGLFTEEDYLLLTQFRLTMDSIYKIDRPTYDELLKEHPGLMDTVCILLKTYTSH